MELLEHRRKERLARRKVTEQLRAYFAGLLKENDPEPLIERVRQMLLEKYPEPDLHA
jgi:hypothetical protein